MATSRIEQPTVTLENVFVLKTVLDAFLILTFRRHGPERINGGPQQN